MQKIHIMGIGGSGVSGVAILAMKMGYEVSGCDLEENTAYGKNIFKGHDPRHLDGVDFCLVSPAILYQNAKHPELSEASRKGILMTWQEFLGKHLLKNKKQICIAGTHGKSTTTAMAGKLLTDAGLDPIVMIGARVPEWNGSSRFGKGEYAVIEADEFNNNFLHYSPEIAIINNIEFDHPDYFKNEVEVQESFSKFSRNLVGRKILITQKDSLNKKFNLKVFGAHNQKNANMVYVLGKKLGIKDEDIIKSLESFTGIGRRTEFIGESKGIKIFDDYAHHPTAIAATLEGIREQYPSNKIWVVVEPHGYARTHALLKNYSGVFDQADNVIVGPIFKARDTETFGMTPDSIVDVSGHKEIVGVDSFEKIKNIIKDEARSGDIVVIMGAGKSYLWAKGILETLNKKDDVKTSFKNLTALKIGGSIKYYKEVHNKDEVVSAVKFAKENNLSIFILGDGTDILASDNDFDGLVIKYVGSSINFLDNGEVTGEAGANWDKLVSESVAKELQGIECLSGIPGTTGAAPIQNIGAYGQELKDTFVSLEAYDIEKEVFKTFSLDDCKFGYRESIFKTSSHWQKYIICSVTLKLNKNISGKVNYDSLKKQLTSPSPTLSEIRNAVLEIRSKKLEDPKKIPNAGSFFKNPIISPQEKSDLEKKFPDIKTFPFQDEFKIAAASLIEACGWKGKTYKGVGVSAKHALVIINPSANASAKEVVELSDKIEHDVMKKFGIKLTKEVQMINF